MPVSIRSGVSKRKPAVYNIRRVFYAYILTEARLRVIYNNIMSKKIWKILISIIVVLACAAVIQGARYLLAPSSDDPFRTVSKRTKGRPGAPIHIIEYMDFRCGPCGFGAKKINEFMRKYPGQIFLEMRYFPLQLSHGAITARFTECALKQNKFWQAHDALIDRKKEWISLPNPEGFFLKIAVDEQMNAPAIEACWNDPNLYDEIMDVKHLGKELGVRSTPTYFINGKMVVGAKKLMQELEALLGLSQGAHTVPGKER